MTTKNMRKCYCIVSYSIVLYCIVLYCIVLYGIVLCIHYRNDMEVSIVYYRSGFIEDHYYSPDKAVGCGHHAVGVLRIVV